MQVIDKLHAQSLYQLTGCRYPVLRELCRQIEAKLPERGLGRPFAHTLWTRLVLALAKLRGAQAYRTMEVCFGVAFVTIQRYTNRICELLADLSLFRRAQQHWLIIDSTSTRVRSTELKDYSGYKHHKNHKVQMIVNDIGQIAALSKSYSGSVHDKTIWNQEFALTKRLFVAPVLADKAYIGAKGENTCLLRPVKHNERQYKERNEESKAFNRELSRIRVRSNRTHERRSERDLAATSFCHGVCFCATQGV